ncbi:radical SAM protein [Thermococcus sp. MV5]|uniref:SPL family radical SAM protein n=1 Tax=Thermococcus sp. MV5 TaxID=1638272 RepID=UPI00143C5B74|nr:radical SAM protein [Thermococcus sp. MV5]NJE26570.1 radical SAM protein [Thermococcus sp. MV5]
MKVIKTRAKNIYTKSRIPGVEYAINQYVGCQFACKYCYAKFICKWKPYGEWGTWVEAKINAPELARKRVYGEIMMSSISDPYQPVEKELKLTRRTLEAMNKRNELSILTKSPLVIRDIDLFKLFNEIEVGLTVNSFERREKHLIEPLTPSQKLRIDALKKLKDEGIKNYAFVSPIIPELTDIEAIVKETRGFVDYYFFEVLNLAAAGGEFREMLKNAFPESYRIMVNEEKFWKFVKELMGIIKELNIKTEGIEIHKRGWEFIEVK